MIRYTIEFNLNNKIVQIVQCSLSSENKNSEKKLGVSLALYISTIVVFTKEASEIELLLY